MHFFRPLSLTIFTAALFATTQAAPVNVQSDNQPATQDFVVILKKGISRAQLPVTSGTKLERIGNMNAIVGDLDSESVEALKLSPLVSHIEPNAMYYASSVQANAPWGLARISQHKKLSSEKTLKYAYDDINGMGTTVYVLDSGVNIAHEEFEGRASYGATFQDGNDDEYGHGTHVAGIIAGKTYGVAKQANIVSVRVLDKEGGGKMSQILAGLDWVNKNADKQTSVINLSLGGSRSLAMDMAVQELVKNGFIVVSAAGNFNKDACLYSPAGAAGVITVAATDAADSRSTFSNYGPGCVDLFAPGTKIKSSWIGSTTAVKVDSGTSMAAPFVAGVAATILSSEGPMSAEAMKGKLLAKATSDAVKDAHGSPNKLLYNGFDE